MKDVQIYQFYQKKADAMNKNQVERQANSIINTSAAISCVFRTKYRFHCCVQGYIMSIFCHIQSGSAETGQKLFWPYLIQNIIL